MLGAAGAPLPGVARQLDDADVASRSYNELSPHVGHASFAAELFAAAWALLWAAEFLAAVVPLRPKIDLFSDAQVVEAITAGRAGSSAAPELAAAARGAALELRARAGAGFSVRHVFAHVGHPFNELADAVATAAGRWQWQSVAGPARLRAFLLDGGS